MSGRGFGKRRTGRSEILRLLKEFPEGLSARQLLSKMREGYYVDNSVVWTALSEMCVKKVLDRERRTCEHCCVSRTIYKIRIVKQ